MSAKMVVLILTIMMPQDVPDIQHSMHMESISSCMEGAKDFLSHDLSEELRAKGAIGLSANCAYKEMPSEQP